MSLGNWFLGLVQQLFVDALFKRPVDVTLTRKPDGSFDMKTNIRPSGQQPQQHIYYGSYPGYPTPGAPPVPPHTTWQRHPPMPAPPHPAPGSPAPPTNNAPPHDFPEEFQV